MSIWTFAASYFKYESKVLYTSEESLLVLLMIIVIVAAAVATEVAIEVAIEAVVV